jgi:hypothetical protein
MRLENPTTSAARIAERRRCTRDSAIYSDPNGNHSRNAKATPNSRGKAKAHIKIKAFNDAV